MSRESCLAAASWLPCARQFGLSARLFVNDRKDELDDRLDLMATRPRHHLFDKLFYSCRMCKCIYTIFKIA
jgi:hypothetical protein